MSNEIQDEASRSLRFDMDFEVEKNGVKALLAERLANSGSANPLAIFYGRRERICSVTCRPTHSEEDHIKALHHIMSLHPAVNATSMVLALNSTVKMMDGAFSDAIVIIGVSFHGSAAEAFPYKLNDGIVDFDDDSAIDTSEGLYSKIIHHMFPLAMTINKSLLKPSDLINFLSVNGFDVELHGEFNHMNIDAKTYVA